MQITVHCINPKNMAYWQKPKNYMRPMDFERDYLPGVVSGEMGNCSQIEALKAQAIAARSYAYQYILKGAAIYDTSKAQVFEASRAVSKTYLLHRQAAEETAGIVVCYNGKPVTTNYTHSNGGKVKAYGKAWMVAKDDPWDDEPRKGHGAGMSQSGAENMAKAGKTYAEILAFYYPGTVLMGDYGKMVIMPNDNPIETEGESVEIPVMDKVLDFMRSKVGKKYSTKPNGVTTFDCAKLAQLGAEQAGYDLDSGATSIWDNGYKKRYWLKSGTLDTLPANESAFIFNRGITTRGTIGMKHIAGYDGRNKGVVQAGGFNGKGVHENPFSVCKSHFTHWAILGENAQESTQEPQGSTFPTLRNGSEGEEVKALQNLLNQHGAGLEVDGKFGKITRKAVIRYQEMNGLVMDGIVGTKTWAKLTE